MSEQQEIFNPDPGTPVIEDLPEGWLRVGALDMEAQGIARRPDGKVVFIEGALPGELVSVQVGRKKNNWEQGTVTEIHHESSQRVTPGCPHFGLHQGACGGCKMQHLDVAAQVAVKQRVLEDNLWHLAKVKAESLLRPIQGPSWGYRYRARLSVRYVLKKGEVLIGFHERKSRYIADMQVCPILPPHVSAMLLPLRGLIGSLQARETCPQIELACGDAVTALVLQAVHRMAKRTLHAPWLWTLATLSLLGTLLGVGFAWLVTTAALVGWLMARQRPVVTTGHSTAATRQEAPAWIDDHTPAPEHARYSPGRLLRTAGIGLALWGLTLGGLALLLGAGHTLVRMGGFFT
mgnify:CR=1 FL=1